MTVEHAISRRLAALEECNSDRVLVSPVKNESKLCLPEHGTVEADVIDALCEGLTVEQFMAETLWSKSEVMINTYLVAKKAGVGIERRSDRLLIVWPERAEGNSPYTSKAFEGEPMSELASACAA